MKKFELSDVFVPDIQTNLFSETPFEKTTVGLAKLYTTLLLSKIQKICTKSLYEL